jgi:two-component system aerobic respiration control sensor histidine kinase ArcB
MDKPSFDDIQQGQGDSNVVVSTYAHDLPQNEADLFRLDEFALFDVDEAIKFNANKDDVYSLLKEIIDKSIVVSDVEKLKAAHKADDWDTVQKLAHKIKGGAVYIGAVKMKMACQYLERYWKVGQRALLEKLYQQVLQVIDETLKVITSWLAKEGTSGTN